MEIKRAKMLTLSKINKEMYLYNNLTNEHFFFKFEDQSCLRVLLKILCFAF